MSGSDERRTVALLDWLAAKDVELFTGRTKPCSTTAAKELPVHHKLRTPANADDLKELHFLHMKRVMPLGALPPAAAHHEFAEPSVALDRVELVS